VNIQFKVHNSYDLLLDSYGGHLIKKIFSYPKILRNTKSEKERCTFRGVVDSAHFSSHEKRSYPTFAYIGKHLANYS
jgi:hypothetical protein